MLYDFLELFYLSTACIPCATTFEMAVSDTILLNFYSFYKRVLAKTGNSTINSVANRIADIDITIYMKIKQ